jgi:hypothetical protein
MKPSLGSCFASMPFLVAVKRGFFRHVITSEPSIYSVRFDMFSFQIHTSILQGESESLYDKYVISQLIFKYQVDVISVLFVCPALFRAYCIGLWRDIEHGILGARFVEQSFAPARLLLCCKCRYESLI